MVVALVLLLLTLCTYYHSIIKISIHHITNWGIKQIFESKTYIGSGQTSTMELFDENKQEY